MSRLAIAIGIAGGLLLRRAVLPVGFVMLATSAGAQRGVDLNRLALDWARGRYLSPVICEVAGELVRGGRRIMVAPGPRHSVQRVGRVTFSDLEVDDAKRCFNELGKAEPNVIGSLQFRLLGREHPDTAQHDFAAALRRRGGFDFRVTSGALKVVAVGGDELRIVDFRGGSVKLRKIERGSDHGRLLADLRGGRRLLLELEARDGTRLSFPLVMTEDR